MNIQFLVGPETTTQEIATCIASHFVGVDRPEGGINGNTKILTSSEGIASLAFGEKPNAIGLFDGECYGIALIQIAPESYYLLMKIYLAANAGRAFEFSGIYNINMTPMKVWLPVAT